MNQKIDMLCLNFQAEIVETFNKYNSIPFILKYYLFKQIWQKIEQEKMRNDYRAGQQQQQPAVQKTEITE